MKSAQAGIYNDCLAKKFMFRWVNSILLFKMKSVETKAMLNETMLEIESQTQYLRFIKKKMKSLKLPLNNIKAIKSKRLLGYSEVILTTNLDNEIKIPTNNKELAADFVGIVKDNTGIV